MKSHCWLYPKFILCFILSAIFLAACSTLGHDTPEAIDAQAHEPLVVTRTTDDGFEGELRSAIMAAQAGGIIVFADDLEGAEIVLRFQLSITKSLSIVGPTGGITISGDDFDRVFAINGPTGGNITVNLENLTITKGYASGGSRGGGILNGSSSTLTIKNSNLIGNSSSSVGGGIANSGSLSIINSTIAHNHAEASGGGIDSFLGKAVITNSTISTNSSATRAGALAVSNSTVELINSTVTGNTASYIGGIMLFDGFGADHPAPELKVVNSIIAGNVDNYENRDVAKYLPSHRGSVSASHSLIGTVDEQFGIVHGADGNLLGLEPEFELDGFGRPLLADNGGPTLTHALLSSSPAVDAGDDAVCAAEPINNRDQRGVERPQGTHCDMGAFESLLEVEPPAPVSVDSLDVDTAGTVDKDTGVAVISGTMTCEAPGLVTLRIDLSQEQKQRRIIHTVVGSTTTTVSCYGVTSWAAAVTGTNGVFINDVAQVAVEAVDAGPVNHATEHVRLKWSKSK